MQNSEWLCEFASKLARVEPPQGQERVEPSPTAQDWAKFKEMCRLVDRVDDILLGSVLRKFCDHKQTSNWGNYVDVSVDEVVLDGRIEITLEESEALASAVEEGKD